MIQPELTPLERVMGFTEPIRLALGNYWITSAEEFATTARLDNAAYGDGLAALGFILGLNATTMDELYAAAVAASPRAAEYSALVDLDVGDGLLLDNLPPPAGVDFAPPMDLPPEVLLGRNLPPVLDQGRRNTCVAFTMVAMYQVLSGDSTDLSEQFLFWACKQFDGQPDDPRGTTPEAAIQALKKYGICLESDWAYSSEPIMGNVGHGPPPHGTEAAAITRQIISGGSLDSTKSMAIRIALTEGHPVLLGLPCYGFWNNSGQARRGGRVRKQLPGEIVRGGHAVCAVGYRDDQAAPGGGYIIIRNSWGTDWGSENADGVGYGHVPYDVVDEQNLLALVIDVP
jgi:Papain family cysteine protease